MFVQIATVKEWTRMKRLRSICSSALPMFVPAAARAASDILARAGEHRFWAIRAGQLLFQRAGSSLLKSV